MVDVLTPEQRSLNMSRIRGRDTKPELLVRRGLHARGLRFRIHRKNLPGRPDLVLARFRTAIFVHGCFWHGHACHLSTIPATRTAFWQAKIAGNIARDRQVLIALQQDEWRVMTVWECAMRGRNRLALDTVLDTIQRFLRGQQSSSQIHGTSWCRDTLSSTCACPPSGSRLP